MRVSASSLDLLKEPNHQNGKLLSFAQKQIKHILKLIQVSPLQFPSLVPPLLSLALLVSDFFLSGFSSSECGLSPAVSFPFVQARK